ncbi:MAG: tRNA uridine-5-carboxymethylaminomethyl(34) synthesis enzyme MnmG [Bacteroidetes bacterium]|nr:tRNA uridine-5-carboxymethylaminomethyl(34) synthesis enzyme MnmG [Bacteroidota bacterium]
MFHVEPYDVLVVGAGHAGCEAAAAAANMGCRVLLATMNMNTIAQMSCNPAMGGIAKGQIVRELDALGGYSGLITDRTMIQFRMLNRKKGPAMWSPRAQSDRMRFAEAWRLTLEGIAGIDFWQEMITGLVVKDGRCVGVRSAMGREQYAQTVILTNGTFLNGIIHVGHTQYSGGRSGERASRGITEQLVELGFESGRMKTGTPPRVDGRSIRYEALEVQEGDEPAGQFSYLDSPPLLTQRPCYIAYTNPRVHAVLEEGFEASPMFSGRIQGLGPRYCPSIEDKIVRFADKDRHQLFVEPEGWHTVEVYLNGFSSSLPEEVQLKALHLVEGFERAKVFRPGYAIEYDYFPPHQLQLSLETRLIQNLYFAGQINGTTGYEEAGVQGMMAGINAALRVRGEDPFILGRNEAYIGVLIDDLIHKSTSEPYRMFTSRAEYRILLRQDNADLRLTEKSYRLGLASEARYQRVQDKRSQTQAVQQLFRQISIEPEQINGWLAAQDLSPIRQKLRAEQLLMRPELTIAQLRTFSATLDESLSAFDPAHLEQAEIEIKYAGYVDKELAMAEKMLRLEDMRLPMALDYDQVGSLSNEGRQKLKQLRPETLGQASRISGVRPSDISVLMVHLGR